jgi:hypothetical protein
MINCSFYTGQSTGMGTTNAHDGRVVAEVS